MYIHYITKIRNNWTLQMGLSFWAWKHAQIFGKRITAIVENFCLVPSLVADFFSRVFLAYCTVVLCWFSKSWQQHRDQGLLPVQVQQEALDFFGISESRMEEYYLVDHKTSEYRPSDRRQFSTHHKKTWVLYISRQGWLSSVWYAAPQEKWVLRQAAWSTIWQGNTFLHKLITCLD